MTSIGRLAVVMLALCACHQQEAPPAGMGTLCGLLPDSGSTDSAPEDRDCPSGLVCVEDTSGAFEKPVSFCTIPCSGDDDCRFNGCNYGCSPDGFCGVLVCY
jgi:hypothetical protein